MEPRRLYRSKRNNVLGGVAGGIAEYFNLDPLLIRILFVILTVAGGGGLVIYVIMWIFVPENPEHTFQSFNFSKMEEQPGTEQKQEFNFDAEKDKWKQKNNGSLIGGLILITLGILFLLDRLVPNLDFGDLWPLILVVAGIALLADNFRTKNK